MPARYTLRHGKGYSAAAPAEEYTWALPQNFSADTSQRGIIFCHGYAANSTTPYFVPATDNAITVAQEGRAVLFTDMDGVQHWGRTAARDRLTDSRTFMLSQYSLNTKVDLYAISMGTLPCLRWARENPTLVNKIALFIPVLDLGYVHDNNVNGVTGSIESAYGGLSAYQAALSTVSPVLQSATAWSGIPIKVWRATNDPFIPMATADAWAASVGATVSSLGAVGHDYSAINSAEIAAWLA